MSPLTDADVLAAIRARHLKANIAGHEQSARSVVHWEKAWVDPGGTIFGPGPYAKVPISFIDEDDGWSIVVRVYPPERLRKRLAKQWRPA